MSRIQQIDGKPVVDAKRGMVIHITKRDCMHGKTNSPGDCAAARALVRETPRCTQARVFLGRIYIEQGDKWYRFKTPPSIRSEIIAFDRGADFQPGEYKINPLAPCEQLGARAMRKKSPSKHLAPKTKRVRHTVSGVRHYSSTTDF